MFTLISYNLPVNFSCASLNGIDAKKVVAIALANMLQSKDQTSGAGVSQEVLGKYLGSLARENSMLLVFAVSAINRSARHRAAFLNAARGASAQWTRDHVVLRLGDLFRVASITSNPLTTFTAAAAMLEALVLDQSLHEQMLVRNSMVQHLLCSFWGVGKLRAGIDGEALSDWLTSTLSRSAMAISETIDLTPFLQLI